MAAPPTPPRQSTPPPQSPLPRRRSIPFRPRFTLMILYVALFYFLFALAIALPALLGALETLPPGGETPTPGEIELAKEVTREALAGKLLWAFLAALVASAVGAWRGLLPGMRPPV